MTRKYSTSFSLGISFFSEKYRGPIYSIYSFVRLADEIVDSFHDYDKELLLRQFKIGAQDAIQNRISINPIFNAFQEVFHKYNFETSLLDQFLNSMSMDLQKQEHTEETYKAYIYGSAEVVGLMCLRVFTEGDDKMYESLKPDAMKLGSVFQKVNFLRDIRADYEQLGRTYFPGVDLNNFSANDKKRIEDDIEKEFAESLDGIRKLPRGARSGVYLAYLYYKKLFNKIKRLPPGYVMKKRIRISNGRKVGLMLHSMLRLRFNLL